MEYRGRLLMRTIGLPVKVLLVLAMLLILEPAASITPLPVTHYRSIGTHTGILYDIGRATVTGGSSTVTFLEATLPRHVGQGDRLTIDPNGPDQTVCHILTRDSATQLTLQTPVARDARDVSYTITRAYHTIQDWVDDRRGNLVAHNRREVGVLYNDGPFTTSWGAHALATIDGSRTDAAHFLSHPRDGNPVCPPPPVFYSAVPEALAPG
jgi:hypothetical protein